MSEALDTHTAPDRERLTSWLRVALDPAIEAVEIERFVGGHSSGAWRLDVTTADTSFTAVLKLPEVKSVVYRRDPVAEAGIIDAAHRHGAPVPRVLGVDTAGHVNGLPCFVLEFAEGRPVPDGGGSGYYLEGWLAESSATERREVWLAFHDALADLHRAGTGGLTLNSNGPELAARSLDYWRNALLDSVAPDSVPRQLQALDWLCTNIPEGDASPVGICMGDARLANFLYRAPGSGTLIDFEVAYYGHQAADIGYSIFFDRLQRRHVISAVDGMPSEDVTWSRWCRQVGISDTNRPFWTAFGATILCITVTRAMTMWGVAEESVEDANFSLSEWESTIERAS